MFFISKCSGDIIISYMEDNAIFSTRMDLTTGPSQRIKKWSGGGNRRVPRAREGEPPLVRGSPRENFEFLALLSAFLMGFYAFGTRFQSRFLLEKMFLGT